VKGGGCGLNEPVVLAFEWRDCGKSSQLGVSIAGVAAEIRTLILWIKVPEHYQCVNLLGAT
jgi:hypothetical protein